MTFVIDASTALAAVIPDEDSPFARAAVAAALEKDLIAPMLWMYEVQNGLVSAVRRERIDSAAASDALDALRALQPKLRASQGRGREFRLGITHNLTAYDAAYLGVALEFGSCLATNDKRLRNVAEKLGVALFTYS